MTWPTKKLGEVADILGGYAFKSSELKKEKVNDDYLPVIKIGSLLTTGVLENIDLQFHKFEPELSKYLIKEKDILIAMTGATVGKVAISNNKKLLLNQRVGLIRSKETLSQQDFLKYILLSNSFYKYCQSTAGGGAQGNISPSQIMSYAIPLPSIQTQKKIVERLDAIRKAQELCDQQIQKTEELFDSIVGEFENKQIGLVSKLEDLLVEPLQNGINFSKTQMGNGTLLVNVKDVYTENEIEEGKLNRISITEKEITNYSLHDGDVLFVRSSVKRDGVGFTVIFKSVSNEPIVYSGFIIKASVDTRKILPQYLLYVTRSKHLRKRIIESSGTGTITNINQGSINRLQILVPDLKTQQEIVEKLEAVQNYKKLLQKERILLKELFDSVLDKSMKGGMDR